MTDILTYKIAFEHLRKGGKIRNQQHLADLLEVNKATLSQILNGIILPTKQFVYRFEKQFPEFNTRWLEKSEGQMLKTEENITSIEGEKEVFNEKNLLDIFQMMKQLVDSNSKLSAGIENVTESNKVLAANSSKIVDSIQNITANNNILAETNQILAESNARLTSELQGRGKDAGAAKCAGAK